MKLKKLEKNLKTLDKFLLLLPPNRNNNGAKIFNAKLIKKCKKLIKVIPIQPDISPTARNSIQFEYVNNKKDYLEFEIFKDRINCLKKENKKIECLSLAVNLETISVMSRLITDFFCKK